MNIKNSLNFVFLAGLLAATIGIMPLINSGNAFAQSNSTGMNMTKGDNMIMDKNGYGKPMMSMDHKKYQKINGTLNIMETMYTAIAAKFNVTLTDAITTAEQAVGNGSYAMSANGEEKDGYLVYSVILGSPDMKFTKVLVDPGNGSVLQTKNISMMEWMMMMHSQGHEDMGKMGMQGSQGYGSHEKGMMGMQGSQGYGESGKWQKNQGAGGW